MRRAVRAGDLAGWIQGDGPPVLLLHGGPGLSYEYLNGLADEIGPGYEVAAYQQRGLAPSTTDGPFDLSRAVADALDVLDALGWERALVAGHSWGGHLLLHLAIAAPARLLGGLAIDTIGGDTAAFEAEMNARTSEADRARAEELDERAMRGEGTDADMHESMRLFWPAYFASRDHVMPFTEPAVSIPAYSGLVEAMRAGRPRLEASLGGIRVPFGFVAGAGSPIPASVSVATAAAIRGAWADVVDGAGHFPWFEQPGCVRDALSRVRSVS